MATYAEFCCRSGGNNMNGGGDHTKGEPSTSPLYSATNGNWTSSTGAYITAGANPVGTVNNGDFASVFLDGTTTPVFIALVTGVTSTTITLSTTSKVGTAPTTAATGISINVGGAWAGPSGAVSYPFGLIGGFLKDANGYLPRVNIKNDQTYNMTSPVVHNQSGPIKIQGYTTTFGDGGRATFDGGTSGASFNVFQNSNAYQSWFEDLIFQNNGATGSASLFAQTTGGNAYGFYRHCLFQHSRGFGLDLTQTNVSLAYECEAYDCNQSNTAATGGFGTNTGFTNRLFRCYSHNNTGSNTAGFVIGSGSSTIIDCIADTNGGAGFYCSNNTSTYVLIGCDSYNNTGDGFKANQGGGVVSYYMENCNFVKNQGYGININSAATSAAQIVNCGFSDNTSGNTNIKTGDMVDVVGTVLYGTGITPWNSPTTGDFSITLAAAKFAGRGTFFEMAGSKSGTVGYPDIGAAQHIAGPTGYITAFEIATGQTWRKIDTVDY